MSFDTAWLKYYSQRDYVIDTRMPRCTLRKGNVVVGRYESFALALAAFAIF